MSSVSPTRGAAKADPWPQMEKQVGTMLSDLTLQLQRHRENPSVTIVAENQLLESIETCVEAVADMRFALDTAMEHPESFSITTEELQERAQRIRDWEREVEKAQQAGEKIKAAQRKRAMDQDNEVTGAQRENNDFLKQEHDVQQSIMQTDDQTLDRISSGIHRVKDTAVNIGDELTTQEHIIDSIDKGMDRVQTRLDSAMRRVGKLLDSTSDRGKFICIAVLVVILVLLIVFVLR